MRQRIKKWPTRLMIIQTGTQMYLEKGFTATTNMMICKELDISPGQFTYHFPTKEHLLAVLVKELCEFQRCLVEEAAQEGKTSLLAVCLEFATMAAMCEENPQARDFFISAYTHPMTLDIIRRNDAERAKAVFGEYCPFWTDGDFAAVEDMVSGIEFATFMATDHSQPLEKRIRTGLDSMMRQFCVPKALRQTKIQKVLAMDYRALGRKILEDFTAYIHEQNENTVEAAFQSPDRSTTNPQGQDQVSLR